MTHIEFLKIPKLEHLNFGSYFLYSSGKHVHHWVPSVQRPNKKTSDISYTTVINDSSFCASLSSDVFVLYLLPSEKQSCKLSGPSSVEQARLVWERNTLSIFKIRFKTLLFDIAHCLYATLLLVIMPRLSSTRLKI